MDLRAAVLTVTEDGLRVALRPAELSDSLGSPNGFDHVRYHLFFDLPGLDGSEAIPFLNAAAPDGLAWDYALAVDGWQVQAASAVGASTDSLGTRLPVAPTVSADPAAGEIVIDWPLWQLVNPVPLDQIRLYVTTWDADPATGALLPLAGEAGPAEFGGPAGAPLVLDEMLLGASAAFVSPLPQAPTVAIAFSVTVPAGTPADASLFLTGPFNAWDPADPRYRFLRQPDGRYLLTLSLDQGATLEYRITRGLATNTEVLDPADRFATHIYTAPAGDAEDLVEIEVQAWWDD
jgi:hypothetical protein